MVLVFVVRIAACPATEKSRYEIVLCAVTFEFCFFFTPGDTTATALTMRLGNEVPFEREPR